MMSKCGNNKEVAQEPLGKCVTDVLTIFGHLLWSINGTEERQQGIYLHFMYLSKETMTTIVIVSLLGT